jgi:hypothetical protein
MPDPVAPPAADVPKPMPFAIMRNSHEALRASIVLQQQHLASGDGGAFRAEWRSFQRALRVHMAMEDRSMFALLDEVGDGAITAAKLPEEHATDRQLAAAVDAALDDPAALPAAWETWRADHLHHLEHEEAVMMPLTVKTAPTPAGRAQIVHDRLLTPSESLEDFDAYIGWVVRMLSDHGSAANPPKVAVRVFAWGLQHACTAAQWNRLRPIVQSNCDPMIWRELAREFGLEREGQLGAA